MEFNPNKAIYLQLADLICLGVLQGTYPAESRAPSVRELSSMAQVNINTAVRTYEWLQNKGIVEPRRGMGYYVTHEAHDIIQALRRDELLSQHLPALFTEMSALGISMDDVAKEWKKFNENKDTNA